MIRHRLLLLSALVFNGVSSASADSPPQVPDSFDVKGIARNMDGEVLYYEYHSYIASQLKQAEGDPLLHTVIYLNKDFSPLATKQVRYHQPAGLVSYQIDYANQQQSQSVSLQPDSISQSGNKALSIRINDPELTQKNQRMSQGDYIIDAGFDSFVKSNWQKLTQQKVAANLLLMPRASWLKVNINKTAATRCQKSMGSKSEVSLCLEIQPKSFLIRMMAPELRVGYTRERLLASYLGPSNLIIEDESPIVSITYQHLTN